MILLIFQASIIGEIQIGDLLAAPFSYDNMWYRVRVLGFEGDKVDVYYVDFGDSEYLEKSQLRALRYVFRLVFLVSDLSSYRNPRID